MIITFLRMCSDVFWLPFELVGAAIIGDSDPRSLLDDDTY